MPSPVQSRTIFAEVMREHAPIMRTSKLKSELTGTCQKKVISGPHHVFSEILEMPRVARDEFVRFCLFGNQRVPVIVNPRTLNSQALGLFQSLQGFLLGQFLEFNFGGKTSQPGGAFFLSENHPFGISRFIGDFDAASGHRREKFRQKMEAGRMLIGQQTAKHLR